MRVKNAWKCWRQKKRKDFGQEEKDILLNQKTFFYDVWKETSENKGVENEKQKAKNRKNVIEKR